MHGKLFISVFGLLFLGNGLHAQIAWRNVDSLYQPLPSSVHVFYTEGPYDTAVFRAYYLIADLKNKKLDFTADTTMNRRLTPSQFYEKNKKPLLVVNCTFFSFETNRNLNLVEKNGKLVSYNNFSIPLKGKDTLKFAHPISSAIGITKKRKADVAWILTDSTRKLPMEITEPLKPVKDSIRNPNFWNIYPLTIGPEIAPMLLLRDWKMKTAVGGGPVLLQHGAIRITNEEEMKFPGRAINDKHPRTAMGYTNDGKLIILVIEGRNAVSHGATLAMEAKILKDLGCVEALNLDGGGSSCMLVNGKQTIKPSDPLGQRAVPAVFIIKKK